MTHFKDKMGLSRHEVNLRRLLVKCELMIKNNQKDDLRFPKYISSLSDMLSQLKESADSDNVNDYSRRIDNIKKIILSGNEIKSSKDILDSDSNLDNSPSKNNRDELLGTNNTLRSRKAKAADLDELLGFHQNVQEKIVDDMIKLTRNLKDQSQQAHKIIKQDIEIAQKSVNLTERNFSKLKVESEKLAEHSRRACKCWMWVMLIIVMVLFINMVLFMKVMKKKV